MDRKLVVLVVWLAAAHGCGGVGAGAECMTKGDRCEGPVGARASRTDPAYSTSYRVILPKIAWAACDEVIASGSASIHGQLTDGSRTLRPSDSITRASLEVRKKNGNALEYVRSIHQVKYIDLDADGMIDGSYNAHETRILYQGRFVPVAQSKGGLRRYARELGRRTRYVFEQGAWREAGKAPKPLGQIPKSDVHGWQPPRLPPPPAPGQILPLLELDPRGLEELQRSEPLPSGAPVRELPRSEEPPPQFQTRTEPRPSSQSSDASDAKEPPKAKDLGPEWTLVEEPPPELGTPGAGGRIYERPVSARSIRSADGDATEYRITSLQGNEFGIMQSDDGRRVAIEIVGHQRFEAFREGGRVVRCSFRFAKVAYFDLDGNGIVDALADEGKRRASVFHNNQFVDVAWSTDVQTGTATGSDGKTEYVFREGRWEQRSPATR